MKSIHGGKTQLLTIRLLHFRASLELQGNIPKDATGPWGLRFSVPGLHPLALAGLGLSVDAFNADRPQSIIML